MSKWTWACTIKLRSCELLCSSHCTSHHRWHICICRVLFLCSTTWTCHSLHQTVFTCLHKHSGYCIPILSIHHLLNSIIKAVSSNLHIWFISLCVLSHVLTILSIFINVSVFSKSCTSLSFVLSWITCRLETNYLWFLEFLFFKNFLRYFGL